MIAISVYFLLPTTAEHADLRTTMYHYERMIEEERYDRAHNLLSNHSNSIEHLFRKVDSEISRDNLIDILEQNKNRTKTYEDYSHQQIEKATLQLVLAVDAIDNPTAAIWLTWKEDLDQAVSQLIEQEQVSAVQINDVINNWEIIQPAMSLTVTQEKMESLDQSIQQLTSDVSTNENKQQLNAFYQQSIEVDQVPNDNSTFMLLVGVVSGVIILTLSYVGWKKYKGEKHKKQLEKH